MPVTIESSFPYTRTLATCPVKVYKGAYFKRRELRAFRCPHCGYPLDKHELVATSKVLGHEAFASTSLEEVESYVLARRGEQGVTDRSATGEPDPAGGTTEGAGKKDVKGSRYRATKPRGRN